MLTHIDIFSEFHAVMIHKTITHISFVSEIHAFLKYKTINHIVHSSVKLVFNYGEYVYFSFPCQLVSFVLLCY